MRPRAIAGSAISANTEAGAASTTMSARSASSRGATTAGGARKDATVRSALVLSRAATATRLSPSTPASRARARCAPMAPSPPIATVKPPVIRLVPDTMHRSLAAASAIG